MKTIPIGPRHYTVLERLGFNPDVGGYVAIVRDDERDVTVVKQGKGPWRFWTPKDRTQHLNVKELK
jgi:hypothetical protein